MPECKNCHSSDTYYEYDLIDDKKDALYCAECESRFKLNVPYYGALFDDEEYD